jgi:CHASE3 domain sensor protein
MPTYYDAVTGEPVQQKSTYYDPITGEPISGTNVPTSGTSVADTARKRLAALQAAPPIDGGTMAVQGQVAENAIDFATGAAKGVGSTVYNLGKLAHKYIPGMDIIAPDNAGAFEGAPPAALEAEGGWQSAGKTAEQVGEFFVPGAAQAGKLGAVANLTGKAGLAGRMAVEGASAAGVTAAQGGDPLAAGVVGAAVPAASAVAGKVAPAIMNTKIGARAKQFRTGADPGAGIVDEGLTAATQGGMWEKVRAAKHEVGKEIQNTLANSPKANQHPINIQGFVDAKVDAAVRALQAAGKGDAAAAVEGIRTGLANEFAQRGSSMANTTARELWEIKVMIDKTANHGTASAVEATADNIRKAIISDFRKIIGDIVPAVKPLNQRYANLAEAQSAIKATLDASHGIAASGMRMVTNPLNLLAGGAAAYHGYNQDPAKALGILALTAGAKSMPAASVAAQGLRAAGSPLVGTAAARVGAAGVSEATQPDIDDLVEQYRRQ